MSLSEKILKCGLKPYQRIKDDGVWYGTKIDTIYSKITREEYEQIEEYKSLKIKFEDNNKKLS